MIKAKFNYRVQFFWATTPLICLAIAACSHTAETPNQSTAQQSTLNGGITIADSTNIPDDLTLDVNGTQYSISQNGLYDVAVPNADILQLKLSGTGLYDSVHTFSLAELPNDNGALAIPPITLVEKKAGRRLLTFGGDAMMGRRYLEPRWNEDRLVHDQTRLQDMKSVLAEMKPYFEIADYAAINLETILAVDEPPQSAPKSVVFYTHPDITKALEWMGVDYVSLGNNHTYDYLEEGLETTLDFLDQSNLRYSGAGANEADALKPDVTDLDGVPVSAWGYVGWEGRVTPNQVAEPSKGGAAYGSEGNIQKSLEQGSKPDQIDVVQYHGSREYSEGPSESTEGRLKTAIDHGADLVIAHHPHVAQGFELYKNKLIAYSLGNFAFDQFFYSTHAAAAVNVWMDGDEFYRAEIIPLHVKGYKPLPATNSVRTYILDRVTRLSKDRNTIVSRSGGHGVIDGDQSEPSLALSGSRDILFVGDFESYASFETVDRSWMGENAAFKAVPGGRNGQYSLEVKPVQTGQSMTFGQKTFMRVYPADKMRWQGYIQASPGTQVSASIQRRPKGMNRYEALDAAPREPLGTIKVSETGWTHLAFDFEAPSWKGHPARILLTIKNNTSPVRLDDIEVIPTGQPHQGIGQ